MRSPMSQKQRQAQKKMHDALWEKVDPRVAWVLERLARRRDPKAVREGRIVACEACQHFACVCEVRRLHEEGCKLRRAATCPVAIACEPHGRDTCPICDPCTCERAKKEEVASR